MLPAIGLIIAAAFAHFEAYLAETRITGDIRSSGASTYDSPRLYAAFSGEYGARTKPKGSMMVFDKVSGESFPVIFQGEEGDQKQRRA